MKNSARFPVAIHMLMIIAAFQDQQKITSDLIAASTGMNAVTIRNIFRLLKSAGLIQVKRGPAGARLAAAPEKITLYDIYTAVEGTLSEAFPLSKTVLQLPSVGKSVNGILMLHFDNIALMIQKELQNISLMDLLTDLSEKMPEYRPPWDNKD